MVPAQAELIQGAAVDKQRWVIGFTALLAFLTSISYAFVRTSIETIFSSKYGTKAIPDVWTYTIPVLLLAVFIYYHLSNRYPLLTLYILAAAVSVLTLLPLLVGFFKGYRWSHFGLFIWKDVYIILLVEIFWSFAQTLTKAISARKVYWIYGVSGAIGALSGYILSYNLANTPYKDKLFLSLVIIVFLCAIGVCFYLKKLIQEIDPLKQKNLIAINHLNIFKQIGSLFSLVFRNRYLISILLIVGLSQVIINLIDLQFYAYGDRHFMKKELQDAMRSYGFIIINGFSAFFDLFAGLMLLRFLGVAGPLFGVPIAITSIVLIGVIQPMDTELYYKAQFILSKSLDYSLFTIGKEILFSPLSYEEKVQGKALIGMLVYRLGKVSSSFFKWVLTKVPGYFHLPTYKLESLQISRTINFINLALLLIWLIITASIVKRYHKELYAHVKKINS